MFFYVVCTCLCVFCAIACFNAEAGERSEYVDVDAYVYDYARVCVYGCDTHFVYKQKTICSVAEYPMRSGAGGSPPRPAGKK